MAFLRKLESPGAIALLAGVLCYFSAFTVIVGLPSWLTNADAAEVVGYDGVVRAVKPYPEVEARGRVTYGQQVCFHCHSQFVRPVNDEFLRWGPVSQTGEYAWDLPHYFGTRRTGPDLHREGLLRVDDWHYAHFFNPRYTVPHSVMPGFVWLFEKNPKAQEVRFVLDQLDTNGDGMISSTLGDDTGAPPDSVKDVVARARTMIENKDPLSRLDRRGLLAVPPGKEYEDSLWFHEAPESGENLVTDYDGAELPTTECVDLVKYVQRLGTSIGMWRKPVSAATPPRISPFDEVEVRPRRPAAMRVYGFHRADEAKGKAAAEAGAKWTKDAAAWDAAHPALAERLKGGKELFAKHCAGCHGDEGRGNGSAARFMLVRPRDFTVGKYKFRSTPIGSLPLDGDLYRSIFRGLPGSAMPSWRELSDEQIWMLVDHIKSLYEDDGSHHFNDKAQVVPTSPEHMDTDWKLEVMRGRAVYLSSVSQCYNCHGLEGRADGPGWNTQANQWGAAMRPRDLRPRIQFSDAEELYGLMARKMERLVGAEAWKTLAATPAWAALSPADADKAKAEEKRKAFVVFLLGDGPRPLDVFGGADAVKKALGDAYDALFAKGDDAFEAVRMSTAIEKDQPALRMRNGVTSEDLYRLVMTGIEGTAMKATSEAFFDKKAPPGDDRKWHPKEGRQDVKFVYVPVEGKEVKLSLVTNDPRMKAVGVYTKADGTDEYIKIQPGDDWALVHYLQWLMCVPRERTGN